MAAAGGLGWDVAWITNVLLVEESDEVGLSAGSVEFEELAVG